MCNTRSRRSRHALKHVLDEDTALCNLLVDLKFLVIRSDEKNHSVEGRVEAEEDESGYARRVIYESWPVIAEYEI